MRPTESKISVDLLRQLICLDETSGKLYWLRRGVEMFTASEARTAQHICNCWNSQWAGTEALACLDASGHLMGRIGGIPIYAHRAVWTLAHGHWPELTIDHIDGDGANNRPGNLRDVSHQENHRNTKHRRNNTSGHMGVSMNKRLGKWAAHITVDGRFIHLGFHVEMTDAVAARMVAEKKNGFHQNHGRTSHANS